MPSVPYKRTPAHRALQSRPAHEQWARRRAEGWTYPEDAKEKISAALKGKRTAVGKRSPESCERMRQAALRRWAEKRAAEEGKSA
jgi:hypothetical protein